MMYMRNFHCILSLLSLSQTQFARTTSSVITCLPFAVACQFFSHDNGFNILVSFVFCFLNLLSTLQFQVFVSACGNPINVTKHTCILPDFCFDNNPAVYIHINIKLVGLRYSSHIAC